MINPKDIALLAETAQKTGQTDLAKILYAVAGGLGSGQLESLASLCHIYSQWVVENTKDMLAGEKLLDEANKILELGGQD